MSIQNKEDRGNMDKKKKRIIICLVVAALAAVSLISQSVYIYNSNNAKLEDMQR